MTVRFGPATDAPQGFTTGGESNFPRFTLTSSVTMTSQLLRVSFFRATKDEVITQVRTSTTGTAAGATPTICRFGIYDVDSAGTTYTLIASTTNDTSLFAGTNTRYTKSLTASFNKEAGKVYGCAILVVTAATAPTIAAPAAFVGSANEAVEKPILYASLAAQADLPASLTAAGLSTATSAPYVALVP